MCDTDTKFFHANTTIRHKQNSIAALQDNTSQTILNHDSKAILLYEAYKAKLGTSE
jgi:hypothetical protein